MNKTQLERFCATILHISDMPVQIPGSNMYAIVVTINRKMAEDWVEKTNTKNRNYRQSRVRQFAADMSSELWMLTHQAIAFDTDGTILSGQHRLEAIVLSGISIRQLIIVNCSTEERATIDQTLSRTVRDVASLAYNDELSGKLVALARSMSCGLELRRNIPMTPQEVYRFIESHREPIDFILKNIKKYIPGVTTATVLGPVGRAYYTMSKKSLKHFLDVLSEGFSMDDRDRPIILLRNWLLENKDGLRDTKGRQRAYARSSAALMAYKHSKDVIRLSEPKEELFKLPI